MKLENWTIEEQTGYEVKTTFYTDFSIAERYGVDAIRSTFEQSFEGWKDNCEYVTELCMVLNWKMFDGLRSTKSSSNCITTCMYSWINGV